MQEMVEVAKKIKEAGGTLYLVGGAIRDKIIQQLLTDYKEINNKNKKEIYNEDINNQKENRTHDEDYCVTGFTTEQFQSIFPEAKIQGKDFPVFILNGKEIALARVERKTGRGHKEFEFKTNSKITIEEDLKRRDITINSIAQNILTGEIIDPYNGKTDIQNKIIKKTSEAFSEDPLRAYRVARFAASLNFKVEPSTLVAMNNLKEELNTLSKERVFTEFKKALETNKPSIFFEVLKKAQILEVHFSEIENLIGKIQPEKYHPEGDSFVHTMEVVDKSAQITEDLIIRFSCLVHDLGKGVTPKEILPHHYGHDEKGIQLVQKLGNKVGIPHNWIKCGKTACKWHMKAGIFEKMTPAKQVDLIEQVGKSLLGLEGLKIVVACDKNREEDLNTTLNNIQFSELGRQCLKQINGEKIKKQYPNLIGKRLGEKLHEERIKWLKSIDRK